MKTDTYPNSSHFMRRTQQLKRALKNRVHRENPSLHDALARATHPIYLRIFDGSAEYKADLHRYWDAVQQAKRNGDADTIHRASDNMRAWERQRLLAIHLDYLRVWYACYNRRLPSALR